MKYKIKEFMKADISKFYILGIALICLLLLGSYFSYAMFTVTKERNNAISIITGNLTSTLQVDGTNSSTLSVPANTTKTFTVTLSNPNNIAARFNFYYVGSLPSNVEAGYMTGDGVNVPPEAKGVNLEKSGSSGSSNSYKIKVSNNTSSSKTITLGVQVGLDYNDLSLPSNGHLFEEAQLEGPVSTAVLENLSSGSTYDDGTDTFITGEDPNNYIWYSGKLWRAVSVNNSAKTTKLVTQDNISPVIYNSSGNTAFAGSYAEAWLNDTTVDGFLGNLRDYENFIVTDSVWDATMDNSSFGNFKKPNGSTTVTAAVGLLNMYEYQTSSKGATYATKGYLNNELSWWTITPYGSTLINYVYFNGSPDTDAPILNEGMRPSINLKSTVKILGGTGTADSPYRLEGDNDSETDLSGTYLNERYSGEYLIFGSDENNLYRIVSHENGTGTKIVSAKPLKDTDTGTFVKSAFGNDVYYSSSNTIGSFLNGEYLTKYVGVSYDDMIENDTVWYLGTAANGTSYKLTKYTSTTGTTVTSNRTTAAVGLLRMSELMAGPLVGYSDNTAVWLLSPSSTNKVRRMMTYGNADNVSLSYNLGISPALNLKSNVMITSGTGTKTDPFELTITSTPLPPTSDVGHKIDVYSVEGGSIEVNPVSASAGTTITITVLPDKGYEYAGATITNSNGDYLELNANQTSFKMPSGQIIIIPKFTAS